MKIEYSCYILEKYSNITIHENPSNGRQVVPCVQRDRNDEAHIWFPESREHTKNGDKFP